MRMHMRQTTTAVIPGSLDAEGEEEQEEVQRGLDGGRNPQLSKHFTTRTALLHVQRQNT